MMKNSSRYLLSCSLLVFSERLELEVAVRRLISRCLCMGYCIGMIDDHSQRAYDSGPNVLPHVLLVFAIEIGTCSARS